MYVLTLRRRHRQHLLHVAVVPDRSGLLCPLLRQQPRLDLVQRHLARLAQPRRAPATRYEEGSPSLDRNTYGVD